MLALPLSIYKINQVKVLTKESVSGISTERKVFLYEIHKSLKIIKYVSQLIT